MNEASMALDDDVNVEMHRLRTEAVLELFIGEAILMITHNIGFYDEISKIIT